MRGLFSSRLGFILAAAGSAVGLGNIWGFPTQVASNGGAAFVLVYLVMTALLAYPVLVAEMLIGRYAEANPVDAYFKVSGGKPWGRVAGYWGMLTASLILSFYAIVGGWMMAYLAKYLVTIPGWNTVSTWLGSASVGRNLIFCLGFLALTATIVCGGVSQGIERWSKRLMPLLIVIIVLLIIYVATLNGAGEGWRVYWIPDFSLVFKADLIISAMGQSFFSLSLGVGTMLVYGSYISKRENLLNLGVWVVFVDVGVAILSGLLIVPAIYVAQASGIDIYQESGQLISGDGLIFTVLPALFANMGGLAIIVPIAFFALMVIAALTSSISMLEVPVSYSVEKKGLKRSLAAVSICGVIFLISSLIIFNFERMFSFMISLTTEYSQPLLGLLICIFVGWIWSRDQQLSEIKQGNPQVEDSLFWRIWPVYVKYICPLLVIMAFVHSFI